MEQQKEDFETKLSSPVDISHLILSSLILILTLYSFNQTIHTSNCLNEISSYNTRTLSHTLSNIVLLFLSHTLTLSLDSLSHAHTHTLSVVSLSQTHTPSQSFSQASHGNSLI